MKKFYKCEKCGALTKSETNKVQVLSDPSDDSPAEWKICDACLSNAEAQ